MLDLLFPRRCMLCEKRSGGLCANCVSLLVPPEVPGPPEGLESLLAICSYEGAGRELVLALKRGNRRDGVAIMGASLAEAIGEYLEPGHSSSTPTTGLTGVTWAPTTARRRRERGFDQSELLARAVGRHLDVGTRSCMHRTGEAQMGLGEAERRSNPTFSPTGTAGAATGHATGTRAGSPGRSHPQEHRHRGLSGTWVLVDDVVTTGATMSAAAAVLHDLGVESVIGAAIATTP